MSDQSRLDVRSRLPAFSREGLVIALAAAARFGSGILMGTALAVYVRDAGGSPLAVGLLSTAYFFGMTVFAPVWGAVADVTGRRRALLVVTGALATLAALPLLVVDGVAAMLGLRGLYAVFAAGFGPVMLAVVSERGGSDGRGRALGFFNSARALGFTGGQLAVGALLGFLFPTEVFLVIAAVSLVSTLAVAFLADPTPKRDASPRALAGEIRTRLLPAADERGHLHANGLLWLYVALALRNMTVLGVLSLMPVFLTEAVGVPEIVMGALLALNPGGQVVWMHVFGRAADSVGRKPLITAGMAGSGAFAVVAAFATVPAGLAARTAVATLAFLTIAAAFSAMTTGALAFIGDVAPSGRESELMGLRSTAKGVGGVCGPVVFGLLATATDYRTAFLAGSLLAFTATGIVSVRLVETGVTPGAPAPADD